MRGSLISVAVDRADLDRELDGLAQLGVQIIESDAESIALVRERSDLLIHVPALPADWSGALPDLVTVPAGADVPAGVRPILDDAGPLCLLRLGSEASPADLIDRTRELPADAVFFASGAGPSALPITLTALACGGHVRTGLADSPQYAPGEPTRNAVQLAARVVGLAKIAQRPPLSISETRELLGVARA